MFSFIRNVSEQLIKNGLLSAKVEQVFIHFLEIRL